jgi:hypothetical protein
MLVCKDGDKIKLHSKFAVHVASNFASLKGNKCSLILFLKMAVLWDVAPCSLLVIGRRFREGDCLHHQGDKQHPRRHIFILVAARTSTHLISLLFLY